MSIPVTLTAAAVLAIGPRKGLALFFPSTTTYTIPASGWYRLSALGAGGSGGAIFTTTTGGTSSGGGGGAYAESEVYLSKDTVLTITVGAGGTTTASSGSGTGFDGAAGGATTISWPGNMISAGGGGGG